MLTLLNVGKQSFSKLIRRMLSGTKAHPLNFVQGKRTCLASSDHAIPKHNPATGSFMFAVRCSGSKDVDEAVDAAQKAFEVWSKKSPRERGQVLCTAARKIKDALEDIARVEVLDTGKPIYEARMDIAGCADTFEYYGGIAPTISGTHHQLQGGNFAMVQREPLGVVAGIGAWNYPFQVMSWKAAPALACGNTFVYKPSEFTPSTSVLLAEILTESGVPPGGVNVLQGSRETGQFICSHPGISKVSFTGSVATGREVSRACAATIKRVTMELGGKSALLVFEDCDLRNAVKAALLGNFFTQGEVCSNCTRVFVQNAILEEFTDQLVSAARKLKVGDPFEEDTRVGAMISTAHGQKVLDAIKQAEEEGATIACGGERIEVCSGGLYISPCVLTECRDDMHAVRNELFGPVVCLLPFDCEDEAVQRANMPPYGLAAGVMTKDLQRAHRVSFALQAGIVWVNNYNVFPPEVPFGGYKLSGYGRENGMAAINDFTQLKTVYVDMSRDIDCPLYVE